MKVTCISVFILLFSGIAGAEHEDRVVMAAKSLSGAEEVISSLKGELKAEAEQLIASLRQRALFSVPHKAGSLAYGIETLPQYFESLGIGGDNVTTDGSKKIYLLALKPGDGDILWYLGNLPVGMTSPVAWNPAVGILSIRDSEAYSPRLLGIALLRALKLAKILSEPPGRPLAIQDLYWNAEREAHEFVGKILDQIGGFSFIEFKSDIAEKFKLNKISLLGKENNLVIDIPDIDSRLVDFFGPEESEEARAFRSFLVNTQLTYHIIDGYFSELKKPELAEEKKVRSSAIRHGVMTGILKKQKVWQGSI